jgi:hypothetical protein
LKGRAKQLLQDFREANSGLAGTFLMSRLILLSKIVPEKITADLDDPAIERRLEQAIAKLNAQKDLQSP